MTREPTVRRRKGAEKHACRNRLRLTMNQSRKKIIVTHRNIILTSYARIRHLTDQSIYWRYLLFLFHTGHTVDVGSYRRAVTKHYGSELSLQAVIELLNEGV